jgi:hypothetical protein
VVAPVVVVVVVAAAANVDVDVAVVYICMQLIQLHSCYQSPSLHFLAVEVIHMFILILFNVWVIDNNIHIPLPSIVPFAD